MIPAIKKYIAKNYSLLIIAIIISVAAYLRLNKIEDFLIFLGDEGRDVLVVREILHGHLTFLGPRASAGDFYTGPIYYYMMAPFLLLSNYNPVGPAIMVALFSIATTFLIYKFGREWIGQQAAIFASALYAVSTLVIYYSRSSWNPNPMPFFSMLVLYLLYRVMQKPILLNFVIVGILYGIAFQLHYIEIILGVIIFAFILLGNLIIDKKEIIIRAIRQYLALGMGFVIGLSPFLAFEVKNKFPNTITIINFILHGDPKGTDITHLTFDQTISDVFFRLFGRLIFNYPPIEQFFLYDKNLLNIWALASVIIGIASVIAIFNIRDKLVRLLLFLWLILGVGLFGFYHKPIYDYYFEFMFPIPFLLVGNLLSLNLRQGKFYKLLGIVLFIILLLINLRGDPLRRYPNKQYRQVEMISKFILEKTGGKQYNFALITGGNSDHAYRYIFETNNKPPVTIIGLDQDPERKSVTDQLFVVCEENPCQPLGHSLWEVAGFGRAEIADEWQVSVLRVYKLEHFKGE